MAVQLDDGHGDGLTEINVTPLVDVFLVLLVIVLVSAHLLDHKVLDVKLPESSQNAPLPKALELTLDAQGQFHLGDKSFPRNQLSQVLASLAQTDPNRHLLVSVDESQPYREVIALLDAAQAAGLQKASLKLGAKP
jgi:biopolymer transport protein ExbD